jgi:hypothetical protein
LPEGLARPPTFLDITNPLNPLLHFLRTYPEILRLIKFDLMLAEKELEVSLREALLGFWEDLGSIIPIKVDDFLCFEREPFC